MERLILILVSIGLAILDNSIIPFFSIHEGYPSLLFTFAIAYSLVNKREKSVFIGIVTGILQDIFFFNGFGVNCFLNLLLCFLASVIGEGIIKNKKLVPVVSMFIITILKYMGVFAIFCILNIKVDLSKGLYMAVYNAVVMFFGYKYIINIYDDEYTKQRWRFK
ncbi:rod shape-determining protein MreD [Clostridium sp. LQ25]|uniref:rod shape-determining protein MreD n=1 Tax=Clostridium sp. LQ25 TaxID=2992805 RepID=UPI00224D4C7A|nr:rod shape-determining protein MreD [Clostridium sp. LQ25]UZT06804.1 rod shape-determining protein MreD [Clostridium sp. LQ25]